MKIVVVGLRGFPNIQGGIETHCEELFPRIARLGHQITVVRRSGFVKENPPLKSYKGVQFKDLPAPFISGLEAAVHTMTVDMDIISSAQANVIGKNGGGFHAWSCVLGSVSLLGGRMILYPYQQSYRIYWRRNITVPRESI